MKSAVSLFLGVFIILLACIPAETTSIMRVPTRLFIEASKVVAELHSDGTLKQLSLKYEEQDLTQDAARYDVSALNQLSEP
jgi:hypothetical protein